MRVQIFQFNDRDEKGSPQYAINSWLMDLEDQHKRIDIKFVNVVPAVKGEGFIQLAPARTFIWYEESATESS